MVGGKGMRARWREEKGMLVFGKGSAMGGVGVFCPREVFFVIHS